MKSIKSKINFALIFLFAVTLLLGILGILFIGQLAQKTRGTIQDNYSSVDYVIKMLTSLDEMNSFQIKNLRNANSIDTPEINNYQKTKILFEQNLQLESKNITEASEAETVGELHSEYMDYLSIFEKLKKNKLNADDDFQTFNNKYLSVRTLILGIYKLNMDAITDKTNELQSTADEVILYMSIAAVLSILITLSFAYTFPSKIIKPIKELTERIKSISEQKYEQKLEINTKDELGELASAFNTMAERLKLYEAKHIDQLLFEQKRIEAVVNGLEDGVLLIDENRKIVLVNNTVLKLTGLQEKNILSQNIPEVAAYNDLIREIYKTAVNIKSENSTELKPLRIIQKNRELIYKIESEDINTYSEFTKREKFIGTLIILRNITKYREMDKAKTNLLATASHELKTPLSSINLSLKLFEDKRLGELNEEQRGIIQDIKRQTLRLSRVINEILDYSQIETGNIRLKFASVKPEDIIELGVTALMMQAAEKNLDLDTEIEENLPEVNADLEKIVFVFVNLLNNAIRFTKPNDKIQLSAHRFNGEVKFSIKDHGPGISKEDQEKLFQRFTQVGKKSRHGWGLGLAISKEFVLA
ncbi:MAG TPA: histidine kinase dimerization/phospho-acceptor domain-containing protein, partial [Ignavibacteriaceae bacterium]|nr:histidine kinase dimerization/phospho-acceptor domain-containing protein [Ignavibacteriaceae bacterium]